MLDSVKSISTLGSIASNSFSGDGVPSVALGSLNDRYFDNLSNIWYVKRYLGYFNGMDNVMVNGLSTINSQCSISIVFQCNSYMLGGGNTDLFGNELVCKLRTKSGRVQILIGNADGNAWSVMGVDCTPALNLDQWYTLRLDIDMPNVRVILNGELTYNVTGQAISTSKTGFRFGYIDMIPNVTKICNCKYDDQLIPLNEGYGASMSNSNGCVVASLNDGTPNDFWQIDWVPMSMVNY